MGALVGALFGYFFNKTNNKQHVNRGYDSESGTTLHQSHWSGVRNLTGVIGKVSDVVSVVHVHHDFSSRKGAC